MTVSIKSLDLMVSPGTHNVLYNGICHATWQAYADGDAGRMDVVVAASLRGSDEVWLHERTFT